MSQLTDDCERHPALGTFPVVGEPCAALYSENCSWYRAVGDSILTDDAEYGNSWISATKSGAASADWITLSSIFLL